MSSAAYSINRLTSGLALPLTDCVMALHDLVSSLYAILYGTAPEWI